MKAIIMIRSIAAALVSAMLVGCASHEIAMPKVVPHAQWATQPVLGYVADATRRNIPPGSALAFKDFHIDVLSTSGDTAHLRLTLGDKTEEKTVRQNDAFNWNGYHVAVVAVYKPGELGGGLVALEAATIASLPSQIANATIAGGADMRLRIPQTITHVTLHHTGDSRPLLPGEDPVVRLRGLQSWGAKDRNWWDVPYHFLLGVDGTIFEGRDYHYMGETNTTYDPGGHFLISIIGNYNRQKPTPELLNSIADLMAWAIKTYNLPLDRIGGHYNYYANTDCPGKYLKQYLEDGTFKKMVAERLKK